MKARAVEDMKPGKSTCPHCGWPTTHYRLPGRSVIYERCPVCRCRWRPDGKHIVAGRYCPLQQSLPLPP